MLWFTFFMPLIWYDWWVIIFLERFMKEDDDVAAERRKLEEKIKKLEAEVLKSKLEEKKRHRKGEAEKFRLGISMVRTINNDLWYLVLLLILSSF